MKIKKDLLVTSVDENYMDQAKQLFSSVYWNAGWKGDYMLLAHEIPEKKLKWFRDKGILVKRCRSLPGSKNLKIGKWTPVIFSKFYLFTPEFKRWKNIVYLDADIIVRASLDELTKVKGFAAVIDITNSRLIDQIIKIDKKIFTKLKEKYDLKEKAFNIGVFAFNTRIIETNTFQRLNKLMYLYVEGNNRFPEQSVFNLFFYKKFIPLPYVYNYNVNIITRSCNINPGKIKGIILHFAGSDKPWFIKHHFYKEWKNNLSKAEQVNLKKIIPAKKKLNKKDVKKHSKRYFMRLKFDVYAGLLGVFLKHHFPKFYIILKQIKTRFRN